MPATFTIHHLHAPDITDAVLSEPATLFSSAYGIWGPLASEKMGKYCKPGNRIKMTLERLRAQSLAPGTTSVLIRGLTEGSGELAGYAFATRWQYEGRTICWVTQLCVAPEYRREGLATKLLTRLRNGGDSAFGILSSHPAAICAALRAWGGGIEEVDLDVVRECAAGVMAASPVSYVKGAEPRGSLFGDEGQGVCYANTQFWVDHGEPLVALADVKRRGIEWPFGELPEGCEFLVLVKAAEWRSSRNS